MTQPTEPYGSVCECGAPLDTELQCMAPNTIAHETVELSRALRALGDVALLQLERTFDRLRKGRRWAGWAAVASVSATLVLHQLFGNYWGYRAVEFLMVATLALWWALVNYEDGHRDGVRLVARAIRPGWAHRRGGKPLSVAIDDMTRDEDS